MTDCRLKRLIADPGKLIPNFSKDQTEYNLNLTAEESRTTFDITPALPGHHYKIIDETGIYMSNEIEIKEGSMKTIHIIITSDSLLNTCNYTVHISRASKMVVYLNAIHIQQGKLEPSFKKEVFYYKCNVGPHVCNMRLSYDVPPEVKCTVKINKNEPRPSYELLLGCTTFNIKVISLDESSIQRYYLDVIRKEITRYVEITDPVKRFKFEDPISLSPLYCPINVPDYEIWSKVSVNRLNHLIKYKRINSGKHVVEQRPLLLSPNYNTEIRVSNSMGSIVLTYGGCSNEYHLNTIGNIVTRCNETSPFKSLKYNVIPYYNKKHYLIPDWQVNLEHSFYEPTAKQLDIDIDRSLFEYFFYLPREPVATNFKAMDLENPVSILKMMQKKMAINIRHSPEDANLHFLLGQFYEEMFYIKDVYNLQTKLDDCVSVSDNEIEVNEICQKAGIKGTPTLAQQLRALLNELDKEGQSETQYKEKLQLLYEWKVKEDKWLGKLSTLVTDISNSFGKAVYKYRTALMLEPTSHILHYHIGRVLLFEGKYGEAIIHFENTLSMDHKHKPARMMLALAQAHLVRLSDARLEKTIEMLLDALEVSLTELTINATTVEADAMSQKRMLFGDDNNFYRLTNPLLSVAALTLGRMLLKKRKYHMYMKPVHAFHIALLMAAQGWCSVGTGETMAQFEYVIIECQYHLLYLIKEEGINEVPDEVFFKRCEWLHAFISSSILPSTERLLNIQEELCQIMVFYQPCCEFFLFHLGNILMMKANIHSKDNPLFKDNLIKAIQFLKCSIELNGQPIVGKPHPFINDQSWYRSLKMNYMVDRAPQVIKECLKMVENDPPGVHFTPFGYKVRKKKAKHKKVKTKSHIRSLVMLMDSRDSFRKDHIDSILPSSHKHTVPKPTRVESGEKTTTISIKKAKNLPAPMEARSSLFRTTQENEVESKSPISLFQVSGGIDEPSEFKDVVNPPTVYSRLILARAYRDNDQPLEAIRCYNFVRRVSFDKETKIIANLEMVKLLSFCESSEQTLEFVTKIRINENRLNKDDMVLCREIVCLLVRINHMDDPRFIRYCSLLAKHDTKEEIRETFELHGLLDYLPKVMLEIENANIK